MSPSVKSVRRSEGQGRLWSSWQRGDEGTMMSTMQTRGEVLVATAPLSCRTTINRMQTGRHRSRCGEREGRLDQGAAN